MRKISKFLLRPGPSLVEMPEGASLLSADAQPHLTPDQVGVQVYHDPAAQLVGRRIFLALSDHPFDEAIWDEGFGRIVSVDELVYVGAVHFLAPDGSAQVGHVFDGGPSPVPRPSDG